jgi:hypothetical protein
LIVLSASGFQRPARSFREGNPAGQHRLSGGVGAKNSTKTPSVPFFQSLDSSKEFTAVANKID